MSEDAEIETLDCNIVFLENENCSTQRWPKNSITQNIVAAQFDFTPSSITLFDVNKQEVVVCTGDDKRFVNLVAGRHYKVVGTRLLNETTAANFPIAFGNGIAAIATGAGYQFSPGAGYQFSPFNQPVASPPPIFPFNNNYSPLTNQNGGRKGTKRNSRGKFVNLSTDEISNKETEKAERTKYPFLLNFKRFQRNSFGVGVECYPKTDVFIVVNEEKELLYTTIVHKVNKAVRQMDKTNTSIVHYSIYKADGDLFNPEEIDKDVKFWQSSAAKGSFTCASPRSLEREKQRLLENERSSIKDAMLEKVAKLSAIDFIMFDAINSLQSEWECIKCCKFMKSAVICNSCRRAIGCNNCFREHIDKNNLCPRCFEVDLSDKAFLTVRSLGEVENLMENIDVLLAEVRAQQHNKLLD